MRQIKIISTALTCAMLACASMAATPDNKQAPLLGSEGGNPNGYGEFTPEGKWGADGLPVEIPQLDPDKVANILKEIEGLEPDGTTYGSLFRPEDQLAFDEVQANLIVLYYKIGRNVFLIKRAFLRGVPAIVHASQKDPRMEGYVAERVRAYMKEKMRGIIFLLDQAKDANAEKYRYHKNATGEIDGILAANGEVIFGAVTSKEGWIDFEFNSMLYKAAGKCKSEVCVDEIASIALDLFEQSKRLDQPVKFKNGDVKHMNLFVDMKHAVARRALSVYIRDRMTNTNVNAPAYAALAFTNVMYITAIAPIDFIRDLRMVRVSLDFDAKYYNFNARHGTEKAIIDSYKKLASQKMQEILE